MLPRPRVSGSAVEIAGLSRPCAEAGGDYFDYIPRGAHRLALAMGDALAVSLLQSRGFTEEDFARSHPGGSLGRRLLLMIDDIMHTGTSIPVVHPDTMLSNALVEMTQNGLGMTAVIGEGGKPENPARFSKLVGELMAEALK